MDLKPLSKVVSFLAICVFLISSKWHSHHCNRDASRSYKTHPDPAPRLSSSRTNSASPSHLEANQFEVNKPNHLEESQLNLRWAMHQWNFTSITIMNTQYGFDILINKEPKGGLVFNQVKQWCYISYCKNKHN